MTRLTALALITASLAGCVAAPPPAPVAVDPIPAVMPSVTGVAGLQTREPDACHAATYRSAVGQPGSSIPMLGITREYRIVEYRGIEGQEYDPLRIVFRLDAAGNIQSVDCG